MKKKAFPAILSRHFSVCSLSSEVWLGHGPVRPVLDTRFRSLSCFFLILCYLTTFIKGGRWEAIFFVLSSSSIENLISETQAFAIMSVGLFHETDGYWSWKWRWVRWVYRAYNIFTLYNILRQFLYSGILV